MTKDGSSKSKSKTPRSSKSRATTKASDHEKKLSGRDGDLFRSFQSNLLSLISHELRTPLTGILSALGVLDEEHTEGEFKQELVSLARRNAQKLNHVLGSLLDLAAIESGTFHARLKEMSLSRTLDQVLRVFQSHFRDQGIQLTVRKNYPHGWEHPILGDPQKMIRVFEQCVQVIFRWAKAPGQVEVDLDSFSVSFRFVLKSGMEKDWDEAIESKSKNSELLFSGVLQGEEQFLSRTREGLGSEFLLIDQILKLHQGTLKIERKKDRVFLRLALPELNSQDSLVSVLSSRVYESSTGLNSVALCLIQLKNKDDAQDFQNKLRAALFRSTDAAYCLPSKSQVAVVMDDCQPADVPALIERMQKSLGDPFVSGTVTCPEDGIDPEVLIRLAEERIKKR